MSTVIALTFRQCLPARSHERRSLLSRSRSRICSRGRSSFQVLLPREEVPFKDLLPQEVLLLGPAPMRRGPVQGPAPVGEGHVQVLLPQGEEVPFKVPLSPPKDHRYTPVNIFFSFFFGCVWQSVYMRNDAQTSFSWFDCYFMHIHIQYNQVLTVGNNSIFIGSFVLVHHR